VLLLECTRRVDDLQRLVQLEVQAARTIATHAKLPCIGQLLNQLPTLGLAQNALYSIEHLVDRGAREAARPTAMLVPGARVDVCLELRLSTRSGFLDPLSLAQKRENHLVQLRLAHLLDGQISDVTGRAPARSRWDLVAGVSGHRAAMDRLSHQSQPTGTNRG
jgi:hypothetical protein